MFGWGEAQGSHQEVYDNDGGYNQPNREAKFSHELVAGAAAFEGMKLFEDNQRKEGKTVSHGFAKELLAGFAGGEVDKLAETHGMNEVDKLRAHHRAKEHAKNLYDQQYGGSDDYNPNQQDPPQNLGYRREGRYGGDGNYGGGDSGYGGGRGEGGGDSGY